MEQHDAETGSLAGFIDKWQARWPEWGIAAAFLPADLRERAFAWFALLQELTDAAWAGGDPTPGLAKLAWWQEELRGWAKGARRHPLGMALQKLDAPWDALGVALAGFPATRTEGVDRAALLLPLAAAIADCERVLFGGADGQASPVALLATHALATGDREAARLGARVAMPAGTRPRRLHDALLILRLRRLVQGKPPAASAGWRVLLMSWRVARGD